MRKTKKSNKRYDSRKRVPTPKTSREIRSKYL